MEMTQQQHNNLFRYRAVLRITTQRENYINRITNKTTRVMGSDILECIEICNTLFSSLEADSLVSLGRSLRETDTRLKSYTTGLKYILHVLRTDLAEEFTYILKRDGAIR